MIDDLKNLAEIVKTQQKVIAAARDALREAISEAEGVAEDADNAVDELGNALEYIRGAIDTLSQQQ